MSDESVNDAQFGRRAAMPPAAESPVEPARPVGEAQRQQAVAETATAKRSARRSRGSRNQVVVFLNFLMSIVVMAVLAGGLFFYFGKQAFEGKGPKQEAGTFYLKPNTGFLDTAAQLERQGFISDARIFQAGVRIYGHQGDMKAGEYAIEANASMHQIMDILRSGKSIQYAVTIPEGLTVEQAFQRIRDNEILTGDMPAELPPEGSVVADTQTFTRGATRQQIINKLVADQKKLVESVWTTRAPGLPLADINEFVTLASIVEKETGVNDERPRVAGVFVNRLRQGMRLQSDPTIIYGLFGGKGKPADRPIYQSDIEKATPYNTYVIKGLPPTPIANPGRAALEAVANPAPTKDLYFVADGTGGHVFAETLDQHNKNVAAYRAWLKKQGEAAPAGGAGTNSAN